MSQVRQHDDAKQGEGPLREAPREARMVKVADRLDTVRSLVAAGVTDRVTVYLEQTKLHFYPLARATDLRLRTLLREAVEGIEGTVKEEEEEPPVIHFIETRIRGGSAQRGTRADEPVSSGGIRFIEEGQSEGAGDGEAENDQERGQAASCFHRYPRFRRVRGEPATHSVT